MAENYCKVSVVTICYQAENCITATMESVLSQDYPNLQYVLKDGGSTDATNQIIESFRSRFEEKGVEFIHISERDGGIYDAMNKGTESCTGEFVNFMNADDRFSSSHAVSDAFIGREVHSVDILYGDAYEQEFGNYYRYPKRMEEIEHKMPFNHQACFIRTELMLKYPYNTQYKIAADYDFLLKSYKNGRVFMDTCSDIAIISRDGVSTVDIKNTFLETVEVRKNYGIIEMTEKQYRRKVIIVNGKQFVMNHFPKWSLRCIRRLQRRTRGQNTKIELPKE